MAWSRLYNSLATFEADTPLRPPHDDAPETLRQVAAARLAARAIIDSGAVGKKGTDVAVTLSGHANPNHEPRPEWSSCTIRVEITQK